MNVIKNYPKITENIPYEDFGCSNAAADHGDETPLLSQSRDKIRQLQHVITYEYLLRRIFLVSLLIMECKNILLFFVFQTTAVISN